MLHRFWRKKRVNCANSPTSFGYTVTDVLDEPEKLHLCDLSFDLPLAAPDIDCETLDTYPSTKMYTFSRVILHETLHYSTVGPPSLLNANIVDAMNKDGETAYGPERAHAVNNPTQDDQTGLAEVNADKYAYMVLAG